MPTPKKSATPPVEKPEPPPPPPTNTVAAVQTPAQMTLALGDRFPFRPNILSDPTFWDQSMETFKKLNKPLELMPLIPTEHETTLQVRSRFDLMSTPIFDATIHFTDNTLKRIKLNFTKKGDAASAHAEDVRKLQMSLETAVEKAGGKSQRTGNKLKCQVGNTTIELDSDKAEGLLSASEK